MLHTADALQYGRQDIRSPMRPVFHLDRHATRIVHVGGWAFILRG